MQSSTVARNPEKLRLLLTSSPYGVRETDISAKLRIIQGDVRDRDAVRRTLKPDSGSSAVPDIIVFGIGGSPRLAPASIHLLTVDDPNVCGAGMKCILKELEDIRAASFRDAGALNYKRPLVAAISTTGLSSSRGKRDVPLLLLPLYRWLLAVPHQDKLAMENALMAAAEKEEEERGKQLVDVVIVRPTLLVDGVGSDREMVRVGWEYVDASTSGAGGNVGERDQANSTRAEVAPGPAVGYSVRRTDVGAWLFEEVLTGRDRGRNWAGKRVTLSN